MIRDDIYEYSLDAHHDEETGKKIRRKIWIVTLVLTVITGAEVFMGAIIKQGDTWSWFFTKWAFVIMTIFKAFFIVMTFMHLGDERKGLRYVILVPYILFILYLMFICLWEGKAVGASWPATYAG
ncbi:MAG: cytochrome C oxidase subunit IV family protein [bacterium]|nr:cytochrome C oxidase subunit IV family protein [bacterium]